MPEHRVSVRELAEFCYRSGDIDYRFTPSPTGAQGIEGHQHVSRRRPDSWRSEFPVEYLYEREDWQLLLRGRADGYDASQGIVEEIKTCRVNSRSIPDSVTRVHLAQARLYAAVIAHSEACEQLEVRLTWFNIDSEEEWTSAFIYSSEELAEFLAESLRVFSAWLQEITALGHRCRQSVLSLPFPYPDFREGQRDIAELVYKCVDQSGQLLMEAPTGIGKTAAVLFPALKALASDKHERLIFMTAKSVGRRAAEQTLARFRQAGFEGPALSLTARDKICLSPGKACHGDDCAYARGYYDKLSRARTAAIRLPTLGREEIEALAHQFELCPYQLTIDLLPWIGIVIADLHYFYSLNSTFSALMAEGGRRWTALVDEAHNLPSRARSMYSATLAKADLMAARKQLGKPGKGPVGKKLEKINRLMLALQKEIGVQQEFASESEIPPGLIEALQYFVAETGEQMAAEPVFLQQHPLLKEFYFDVLQFIRVAENWGDDYRFELSHTRAGRSTGHKNSRQSLRLTLNCLDPARLLAQRQQQLHSLTLFSATLSPAQWVHASLGMRSDAVCRRLHSPFDAGQMQVSLATHVDTRFRHRGDSLPALATLLQRWILEEPGNCIVYFPSYRYLQDCMTQLQSMGMDDWGRRIWQQSASQGETARHELLELLQARRDILAFCILGGVFGEGIDLPGEQLSAVVVVGVGLPQVNRDTEQLRGYFQARYGQGFRYAYLYPGMQKVDQALGRVVRRLDDRGRALLVDSRYDSAEYRELLPPWWQYRSLEAS